MLVSNQHAGRQLIEFFYLQEEPNMKKAKKIITTLLIIMIITCTTINICYAADDIVGSVASFPVEISYQDVSNDDEYTKIVETGKNNLKDDSTYSIDHYIFVVSSSKNLLVVKDLDTNAFVFISGKNFSVTRSEVWYTDTEDSSVNTFYYPYDKDEQSLLIVNPQHFNIEALYQ